MVVLGEVLMPIGVLFFLMGIAGLAVFMNFLYLSEGVSSTNPPMAFLWLTIIWLVGTMPGAALYYAIDLRRFFGKRPSKPLPLWTRRSGSGSSSGRSCW